MSSNSGSRFPGLNVTLDAYWRVQNLSAAPESWELVIGYNPRFASKVLQDRFSAFEQRVNCPNWASVLGRIMALVQEIRSHMPDRPDHEEGALRFKIEGDLRHVLHYPLSAMDHLPPKDVFWSRPNLVGGKESGNVGPTRGPVPLATLSRSSRVVVVRLDGHAIATAYRWLEEALAKATDLPPETRLPPRRIKVFIAYRKPHQKVAETVHALLSASPWIFEPYMDRHDLELGAFEDQLFKALREADVFMPLVTGDYGESGSFCEKELHEAEHIANERGWKDFFAPIFIEPAGEVGAKLLKMQGLIPDDAANLDAQPKWGDFEGQVIAAGFRPLA